MRYLLIFVGAAVLAYLLARGIRAVVSERPTRRVLNPVIATEKNVNHE